MIRPLLSLSTALAVISAAALSQAITFDEVARFDVSFAFAADIGEQEPPDPDNNPKYIGTNPLGVAWNGTQLYLAGHDNSGTSFLPIGLTEVLNPTRTGVNVLEDADFSDAFGQIFQPSGRGYTNLELSGNRLAAGYDEGSNTANAIQLFDTSDNSLVWDLSASSQTARGSSGVSFDPGFNGSDTTPDVAWTAFGSGRRATLDRDTGAANFNLAGEPLGLQWLPIPTPGGTLARDLAFDPATGDVYARRNNDVDAADRTGDNATDNRRTLFDDASDAGPFKLGQKLEFIGGTSDGDVVIFNDSVTSAADQAFVDVVKVVDTAGVEQTATFNLIGGQTGADIGDGVGIYDFDYDPASNTLAVLDFFNRNVFIFEVAGAVASLDGDYNDDGFVDAADYTLYRDNLGQPVTLPNDTTSGTVSVEDYGVWADNYGAGVAPSAIPEASAGVLALIGLVAGRLRRR